MEIENPTMETLIIGLEYPTIFLFKLLKYGVDDNTMDKIIRIFLKHHSEYAISNNIATIFIYEDEYLLTIETLKTFYNLIKQKTILLIIIQKWAEEYQNEEFWNMDLKEMIIFLKGSKHQFNSIFDCANGGLPFYYKLYPLLNNQYKDEIMNNIEERLLLVLHLFDKKIFNHLEIPLIRVSDFYELSAKDTINYLASIYTKFNKLLNNMINLFQEYHSINENLTALYFNVNEVEDCDLDDIDLFC
jgi:hypothetical protein